MIRRGFTIIEILVTVSIILILLASAAFLTQNAFQNQRDASRINGVILISKAVDQSLVANPGSYPRLVGATPTAHNTITRFCATYLLDAGNSNHLDLSLFAGQKIPTDPIAASPSATTCDSYLNGFIYHSQYISGVKPAQVLACSQSLFALCQNDTYAIEVGLENQHPDGTLTPTGTTSLGRSQYILYGAPCTSAYAGVCYR